MLARNCRHQALRLEDGFNANDGTSESALWIAPGAYPQPTIQAATVEAAGWYTVHYEFKEA